MGRFVLVGLGSGILFGILDGMINANPLAIKLNAVYAPLMRKSINLPAGLAIDIAYGFIMAAVFLLLYKSLPGDGGLIKGLSFAIIIWFFRVVMWVASSWMMFKIPSGWVAYTLVAGLIEMALLGLFYGLTLKPA